MPKSRLVHVKLSKAAGGDEVLVPLWVITATLPGDVKSDLHIPSKLLFDADWVYDIERRKIIKNKTGRNFLVPMGVQEVSRGWLAVRGYVRVRRPVKDGAV